MLTPGSDDELIEQARQHFERRRGEESASTPSKSGITLVVGLRGQTTQIRAISVCRKRLIQLDAVSVLDLTCMIRTWGSGGTISDT